MMKQRPFNQKLGMMVWLGAILALHGNAILKNEDPIQAVQTEGILYEQKMEQEKDGVKGPATPKVIYYGGQGFFNRTSIASDEEESAGNAAKKKKSVFNWSDWWEEKPAENEAPAEQEAIESVGSQQMPEAQPFDADDFWGEPKSPSSENSSNLPPPESSVPQVSGDDWW